MSCGCALLGLAVFLTMGALALVVTCVATTHWIDTKVDRKALETIAANDSTLATALESEPVYFSRQRGLFSTCYDVTENDTTMVQYFKDEGVINYCIYDEGISSMEYDQGMGVGYPTYDKRNHLLRTLISFFLLVALLYVIGLIVEIVGQCQENRRKVKVASALVLIASFLLGGAMAIFNVVNFYESSSIAILNFPYAIKTLPEFSQLNNHTSHSFGYSYFLGWAALVCGLVAPLLFCTSLKRVNEDGTNQRKSWGRETTLDRNLTEPERPKKGQRKKTPLPKTESIYSWGYAGKQRDKTGMYENTLMKGKPTSLVQSGRFFPAGQL